MTPDRTPPQNLDAERSVLGSCLLSSDAADAVADLLRPEQFHGDAHGKIFAVIIELRRNHKPVDAVTVAERLEAAGTLDDVGGVDSLLDFLRSVPHAAHVEYYAGLVVTAWQKRQVIYAATRAINEAYSPAGECDEILGGLNRRLTELDQKTAKTERLGISLLDLMADIASGGIPRVATGMDDLDNLTGGLPTANVVILAARPSMGKTAFAVNLALSMARRGTGVAFFSLEQSRVELAARTLAVDANISAHRISVSGLDEYQHTQVMESCERLSKLPIVIDDTPGRTVSRIASAFRVARRKFGAEVMIVDYLQLVEPDDKRTPREQQVATMSRQFKLIAKSEEIPVIVLAQLNRQVETRANKIPILADLRESGSIEQDADMVWFIHRPEEYDPEDAPGTALLRIAKHRGGAKGDVEFAFDKETMTFRPLAPWTEHGF